MEGTKLTKQEREMKLADEFEKFTSEKREIIQSYYQRFAKLMNDININGIEMNKLHINTKFLNNLQPEWRRFVNGVKQARDLHMSSMINCMQNQDYANEIRVEHAIKNQDPLAMVTKIHNPPLPTIIPHRNTLMMYESFDRPTSPDSGLAIPTFNPTDDPIESLNKFLSKAFTIKYPNTNNQLQTLSKPSNQAKVQDGRVTDI
ncbi:hypothetical protein Tco_0373400 [Tanacetum coccineum]